MNGKLPGLSRSALAVPLLLAGLCGPVRAADQQEVSAVFLADPQIHNVHGSGIKQTLGISDLFSRVAQRPPELNLLAPHVLAELASRARAGTDETDAGLVFVLGDATNIGCTGEYDAFRAAMVAGFGDVPILMAHGNHDSYLMGTANSYVPGKAVADWRPEAMASADLPVDESWWGAPVQPTSHKQNTWKHICHDPSGKSLPINKVQWLARYFAALAPHGVSLVPGDADKAGDRRFSAQASPGSPLAAANYQAIGRWARPRLAAPGTAPARSDLQVTYTSYVVQAVDLGDTHRIILVDTSVCEKARGGVSFPGTNAGTNSCMGQDQLDDIGTLASRAGGRHLVFAGHFPLDEIGEKDEFVARMSVAGPRWTYVSAHSHDAMTVIRHGIASEINIGSTTDWPMEYNRLSFDADGGVPAVRNHPLTDGTPVEYVAPVPYEGSELCRHLDAAEKLADADVRGLGAPWESPGTRATYRACERRAWQESADRLAAAVAAIRQRLSEPGYRQRMLEVAGAASRQEYEKNLGSFWKRIE